MNGSKNTWNWRGRVHLIGGDIFIASNKIICNGSVHLKLEFICKLIGSVKSF